MSYGQASLATMYRAPFTTRAYLTVTGKLLNFQNMLILGIEAQIKTTVYCQSTGVSIQHV